MCRACIKSSISLWTCAELSVWREKLLHEKISALIQWNVDSFILPKRNKPASPKWGVNNWLKMCQSNSEVYRLPAPGVPKLTVAGLQPCLPSSLAGREGFPNDSKDDRKRLLSNYEQGIIPRRDNSGKHSLSWGETFLFHRTWTWCDWK